MKETLEIIPEDLEISSVGGKDRVLVPDDRDDVNKQGFKGQLSVPNPTSSQDDAFVFSEFGMCQEFNQSLSLDATVPKCLHKCNTFPVLREMHAYSSSTNGRADLSNAETRDQNSAASGSSLYSRSISLPSSSSLVSAMKGGRALNGTIAKLDLRVKWAPDVYEPPSSSLSHTVNAHPQRLKSKKKDKRKYKGKSSRGNGNERKHGNKKNSNAKHKPANARLQANDGMMLLDEFGKPKFVDILEYGFNGQQSKCGSIFLNEGQPKFHLPIGEAS